MFAADRVQRAARYLVEHAYGLGVSVGIAEFLQRGRKFRGNLACLLRRACQRSDPNKCCRDVVEAARPDDLDFVAGISQLAHDVCGRAALPREQEVGLQHCEPFLVDRKCVADQGQCLNSRRIIGIGADTHQRIAGAGGKYEFGQVWRERNDARGMRHIRGRL